MDFIKFVLIALIFGSLLQYFKAKKETKQAPATALLPVPVPAVKVEEAAPASLPVHEAVFAVSRLTATDLRFSPESGKEARLVIRNAINGNVQRLLLLWWKGKHRSVRMNDIALNGWSQKALADTFREAREIAEGIFVGRKPKVKAAAKPEVQPVKKVEQVKQAVELVVPAPAPAEAIIPISKKPVFDGCIEKFQGVITEVGMVKRFKGPKGNQESYDMFAIKVSGQWGDEVVTGTALKDAIEAAKVVVGDNVEILHLENKPCGKELKSIKKIFSVKKLDPIAV